MRMPTSGNVQRASAAAKGLDLASQVRCPSQSWRRCGGGRAQSRRRCGSGRELAIALDRFILVMLGSAAQWFSSLCPVCGSKVEGYACERYEVCSMRSDACRTVCAARRASNMRSVLQSSGACCLLMFSVACCNVALRVACLRAV